MRCGFTPVVRCVWEPVLLAGTFGGTMSQIHERFETFAVPARRSWRRGLIQREARWGKRCTQEGEAGARAWRVASWWLRTGVYAGVSAEPGQREVWSSAKQAWKKLSELKQAIKN